MSERDDIDMLAAEYVLGTLDGAERAAIAARRQREPDLDTAIEAWTARLAPLNDLVIETTPRDDLLDLIQARIAAASDPAVADKASEIIELRGRLTRWKVLAFAASLTALLLAGLVAFQTQLLPDRNQTFVAVFNQGDQQPAFVLSVDLKTRRLTIRPVSAAAPAGKSYELWIVSERFGKAPKSLGLLDDVARPTHKPLPELTPTLLQEATFGISLEPRGGSPVGRPTGPALHGRLIPAGG